MKEKVNQYNLKHPTDKGATELTEEAKTAKQLNFPSNVHYP